MATESGLASKSGLVACVDDPCVECEKFFDDEKYLSDLIEKDDKSDNVKLLIARHIIRIHNLFNHNTDSDDSILTLSIFAFNDDFTMWLIENGADIKAFDYLIFSRAILYKRYKIIDYLFKQDIDINCRNGEPLLFAIHNSDYLLVEKLLKYGADININNGAPLLEAVANCSINGNESYEMVELLIKYGVNLAVQNCEALRISARRGNRQIIKLLIKYL